MYETGVREVRPYRSQAIVAYDCARALIVDHVIGSGESLTENRLVELSGVSRTPVREALQRLEAEGFVVKSTRGYVVTDLTDEDIAHAYDVREVLEGLAAFRAAGQITRATLGQLEDLYEAMERAREADDFKQLNDLNSQFHRSIAQASQNTYLISMIASIYDIFERFRPQALQHPGRRDAAAREHGELIRALRDGDADGARELAERHVREALKTRRTRM